KHEIIQHLHEKMKRASQDLEFEQAAQIRDKIKALERIVLNVHFSPEKEKVMISSSVLQLQEALNLEKPPIRIAGFDIGGSETGSATGSCVIFENGLPLKEEYRRFRMKTSGPNDYAMIQELIERRYKRVLAENIKHPDLILVDGGLGQVNIAKQKLNELGLKDIPIVGLAKEKELIFFPNESTPISLPADSEALFLLQRVRDEAHRFAISYHRKLRLKNTLESILDQIPGIGKKRKQALIKKFGSIQKIKHASIEELAETPTISLNLAKIIHDFFLDKE
ncbi:MAG: UvrB/UvrC motif-containing protein, partial [Candidatus Helarchaeales archaeon]